MTRPFIRAGALLLVAALAGCNGDPGTDADAAATEVPKAVSAAPVGKAAVDYALKGLNGVMPVIVRTSHRPYRWKVEPAALDRIANAEKTMPKGFIDRSGYGITAACRTYLEPLIRGEAPPRYRPDGLPDYVRLKLTAVARKLPPFG